MNSKYEGYLEINKRGKKELGEYAISCLVEEPFDEKFNVQKFLEFLKNPKEEKGENLDG